MSAVEEPPARVVPPVHGGEVEGGLALARLLLPAHSEVEEGRQAGEVLVLAGVVEGGAPVGVHLV